MLEILFLSWFARKLAAIAKGKGRSGRWGGLGVLFWITGEISGFVIGLASDVGEGGAYLLAIVLAGLGALIAYLIVNSIGSSELAPVSSMGGGWSHHDPSNPYSPPGGDPTRKL